MASDWSFGDEPTPHLAFQPGEPQCHNCGAPAPEGIPAGWARCAVCGYHLHTCPNCLYFDGLGCLLLSPFIWSESGVMGQSCPSFQWRADEQPRNALPQGDSPTW